MADHRLTVRFLNADQEGHSIVSASALSHPVQLVNKLWQARIGRGLVPCRQQVTGRGERIQLGQMEVFQIAVLLHHIACEDGHAQSCFYQHDQGTGGIDLLQHIRIEVMPRQKLVDCVPEVGCIVPVGDVYKRQAFAYGRREYQSANRIIIAIQLIPMAFSATITSFFINRGLGVQYWIAMIVLIIIGILSLIPLLKVKDANAADRA